MYSEITKYISQSDKPVSKAQIKQEFPGVTDIVIAFAVQDENIISPKAIKLLRMYYYVDISSISNFKIDEDVKVEIDNFINAYYDDFTGLYINSKK